MSLGHRTIPFMITFVSAAAAASLPDGSDAERCYADVFLLPSNPRKRGVPAPPLPSMPEPLSFMAGALGGPTLYVAGGQHTMKNATPSTAFWSLDLSKRDRPAEFK